MPFIASNQYNGKGAPIKYLFVLSNLFAYFVSYIPRLFGHFHIPTVFKGKPRFGCSVKRVKSWILMEAMRKSAFHQMEKLNQLSRGCFVQDYWKSFDFVRVKWISEKELQCLCHCETLLSILQWPWMTWKPYQSKISCNIPRCERGPWGQEEIVVSDYCKGGLYLKRYP